jgi:hypothetical protein
LLLASSWDTRGQRTRHIVDRSKIAALYRYVDPKKKGGFSENFSAAPALELKKAHRQKKGGLGNIPTPGPGCKL